MDIELYCSKIITPVAFLVKLEWPDSEYINATEDQVAAIKKAIECICGIQEVQDLFDDDKIIRLSPIALQYYEEFKNA